MPGGREISATGSLVFSPPAFLPPRIGGLGLRPAPFSGASRKWSTNIDDSMDTLRLILAACCLVM